MGPLVSNEYDDHCTLVNLQIFFQHSSPEDYIYIENFQASMYHFVNNIWWLIIITMIEKEYIQNILQTKSTT